MGRTGTVERSSGSQDPDPGVLSTAASLARKYGMEYREALWMTMRIWGVARSAVLSMGRDGGDGWRGLSRDEKAEVCGTVVRTLLDAER